MATEEFIQIELRIPDDKELLNELQVMIRERELYLSPSKKPLTDNILSLGLVYGLCTNLEIKSIIHSEVAIILTFKPVYYDKFSLWMAYIECSVPLTYKVCYDRQGIVSHIQLVKGDE